MSDGESQKLTELKNTMAAYFNQTISTVECRQKSTCVYIILHFCFYLMYIYNSILCVILMYLSIKLNHSCEGASTTAKGSCILL